MTDAITFDSKTELFTYPDGTVEHLNDYQKRKDRFEHIESLQNALEQLKNLYQNPGSLTEESYKEAKYGIQDAFDFWEANLFVEFEDSY